MSLQQYNSLISNLLKEKYSFTKLRKELEGRRRKLCFSCKGFKHLARNCRNKREKEKGTVIPQNKFEVLRSRIIQCRVERRTIRRVGVIEVKCFKYGEKRHKCKEYLLWVRKENAVHRARSQKVQQEEKLAYPVKGKAQEKKRRLRRVEKREAAYMTEPQEV